MQIWLLRGFTIDERLAAGWKPGRLKIPALSFVADYEHLPGVYGAMTFRLPSDKSIVWTRFRDHDCIHIRDNEPRTTKRISKNEETGLWDVQYDVCPDTFRNINERPYP